MGAEHAKDEMLFVTIYADTISDFTGAQWNDLFPDDNMIELYFPRTIVEEWYVHKGLDDCDADWTDFDDWFNNYSDCDSTDGLYTFANKSGFVPELPPSKWSSEKCAWVWDVGEDGESVGEHWTYREGRGI